MSIDVSNSVAGVVAEKPATALVFQSLGIDYCCGGKESVHAACERKGLDVAEVTSALEAAACEAPDDRDWTQVETGELIEHLLAEYHESGYFHIDQITQLVEKVHRVHGEKWGDLIPRLHALWFQLAPELLSHFRKEENVLFPMMHALSAGAPGPPLTGPLSCMFMEHDTAGAALEELTQLTGNFVPPEDGCATVFALWDSLKRFDGETRRHIHLENHVLFPRFQPGA